MANHPILYSFRRCPYAIRARMALYRANIRCELREVVLKEKPESMLLLSEKGTVPVLYTNEKVVIEQSLDVMYWALKKNDPDNWLDVDSEASQALIKKNDNEFKFYLDRYKYYIAYPEHTQEYYRDKSLAFLALLEQQLEYNEGRALLKKNISLSDVAIFPFIRQFANVDLEWFRASPYKLIKSWYDEIEQSALFQACMIKYEQWTPDNSPVYFPA